MEHNYDLKENLKDNPETRELIRLENSLLEEDKIKLAELKLKIRLRQEKQKSSSGISFLKATPQKPKPKENFISKFFKIFR